MSAKDTKKAVGIITAEVQGAIDAGKAGKRQQEPSPELVQSIGFLAGNFFVDLSRCADALEDIAKSLKASRTDRLNNK